MPKITFQMIHSEDNSPNFSIDVAPGTTLLEAARACGLPLEHACEGYCACATCHIVILEGEQSVLPATSREEDMLDCAWDATLGSRLSCQVKVGETPMRILIPRYSLNPAKMVQQFPEIWSPSSTDKSKEQPRAQPKECKNCCCSSKPLSSKKLLWENAEEVAQILYENDRECDPAILRLTELHRRICSIPNFSDDPEKSDEHKLEKILHEWLTLKNEEL